MMAVKTQKRAAKGGEFGANGEWYEGGKFINTIEENGKREVKKQANKVRKVQVRPYVWVESDKRPLMQMVGIGAQWIDRWNPEKGIKPFMPYFESGYPTWMTLEECQAACDRYNAGELFFE
jgi:hypothetical protein